MKKARRSFLKKRLPAGGTKKLLFVWAFGVSPARAKGIKVFFASFLFTKKKILSASGFLP
jgi:hypothetical protein